MIQIIMIKKLFFSINYSIFSNRCWLEMCSKKNNKIIIINKFWANYLFKLYHSVRFRYTLFCQL